MTESADSHLERSREVAFFLLPRFNMLTLAAALEPLRAANYLAASSLYRWCHLSTAGGSVGASNGIAVGTTAYTNLERSPDLLVLVASWGADHFHDPGVFAWLRRLERQGVELMALEMAVHILARAGLLAGRKATTHWSWMPGFVEKYPHIDAVEQLYASDGNVTTCAGGSAALDLMFDVIGREHGARLAAEVADQMLYPPARSGDAPQRRTLGTATGDAHPDLRRAVALMEAHIAEPLTMPAIADDLGLSQRRLERLFHRHMGVSPVRFSQHLRLQHARVLLTSTTMSIRDVSAACGFNSMTYFSAAFLACFGKRPSDYRQAWPAGEAAPSWPVSFIAGEPGLRPHRAGAPRLRRKPASPRQ